MSSTLLQSVFVALAIGVAAIPVASLAAPAKQPKDLEYVAEVEAWRDRVENSLRRDNGWLTLAGRFIMKSGANTFGTDKDNDIVFPPELVGTGAGRLGTMVVDTTAKTVTLKSDLQWTADGKPFSGDREIKIGKEWLGLDRIGIQVISRDGKYILRLADNKSTVRSSFQGRIWYPIDESYRVKAKFIPYPPGKTIPIVNVIDEVSDEPCPGYVQFKLKGVTHKLDVVGDGDGLFFVMRDKTSGKTTYRPSRFLFVEKRPAPNTEFWLDFNRSYNPPCAFSEFTTCPLPPKQNILKTAIEAGEKVRKQG